MISDPAALQEARDGWEFIRTSRDVIVGNCNLATWAVGFNQSGIRDICFNLLLASAFSVLEDVLRRLRDERRFACKDNRLGSLMASSCSVLLWRDYPLVDLARNDRNQSVHDRVYLPHAKSRSYIAAIENELSTWGVLISKTPELWSW